MEEEEREIAVIERKRERLGDVNGGGREYTEREEDR